MEITVFKGRALFIIIFIVIPVVIYSVSSSRAQERRVFLSEMSKPNAISGIDIVIYQGGDVKSTTISDTGTLDSVRLSLKEAKEIDMAAGGLFPITAAMTVQMGSKSVKLDVLYSQYNGWCLLLVHQRYRCEYIFNLIKQLAAQDLSVTDSAQQAHLLQLRSKAISF